MSEPFDLEKITVPAIQGLSPYVPGEQPQGDGWVKLNTNENPYPASRSVKEAIEQAVDSLRLYPEPTSHALRKALGAYYDLSDKHVIVGNGSDNILDLITRSFVGDNKAGHTVPSYSLYPVVVGMSGGHLVDIPFEASMELPVDAILKSDASVFFLTNPNAPTGVCFSLDAIEQLLKGLSGILVVDEAYIDFGGRSAAPLVSKYQNLIVVQTFSKSRSLAGLRVGFALAHPSIIAVLDRVRDAYNVDGLAQVGALAALQDQATFEANCHRVIATREQSLEQLNALDWFTYPSASNFLFTQPKDATGRGGRDVAQSLFESLKQQKILVRYFGKHSLTCSFIRVSIGTDSQMKSFFKGVESWLQIESHN